jgi:hypothetical protein
LKERENVVLEVRKMGKGLGDGSFISKRQGKQQDVVIIDLKHTIHISDPMIQWITMFT